MWLQGRFWREGRVFPLDYSGGEELNTILHICNSSITHKGIKVTKTHTVQPVLNLLCGKGMSSFSLLFVCLVMAFFPLENQGDEFFCCPFISKTATGRSMCLPLGISQIHPSPPCSSLDTPFLPPLPWLHHLGPEGKLVLSSNIPSRGAAWGLPMSADPRAGLRAGSRSSGAGTTLLPSADLLGPSAGILVRCCHQMGSCGSKLTRKPKDAHWLSNFSHFHTGYEYQDGRAVAPSQHPPAEAVTSLIAAMTAV